MSLALTTPVVVPPMGITLDAHDIVVALGSCFSDEIGRRLQMGGMDVELNPFGTLYNPASMASALSRMMDNRPLTRADLVQHEGLWHSWHHHGSFSRTTAEECLEACNARLAVARMSLREARLLLLTFGTAWVYELIEGAETEHRIGVVANCHKVSAACFRRRRMEVGEIARLWLPLIQRLSQFNPRLQVVFTVSPIRHLADGAHGNQISKATLLLAVEELLTGAAECCPCAYFPSYEIALDELRDYRFYAADMKHLTPLAVDIIYDRFEQSCMTPQTRQSMAEGRKKARLALHRPLHPPTESAE